MNKGVQTGPPPMDGWTDARMETQTQSTAAELFVPLPILMPSVVARALTAPSNTNPHNNTDRFLDI